MYYCVYCISAAQHAPLAGKSDGPAARPPITDLIDELDEVENQV